MSGTQLAQAIKHEWPDMTVLLATGYADIVREDDIGLPKLTKPFFQRELADAIARVGPKRRKGGGVVPLRTRPTT
jgi:FixJ family two-component response regulator